MKNIKVTIYLILLISFLGIVACSDKEILPDIDIEDTETNTDSEEEKLPAEFEIQMTAQSPNQEISYRFMIVSSNVSIEKGNGEIIGKGNNYMIRGEHSFSDEKYYTLRIKADSLASIIIIEMSDKGSENLISSKELKLTNCPQLKYLGVEMQGLNAFDIGDNTENIETIELYGTYSKTVRLETLDVSGAKKLKSLSCDRIGIKRINAKGCISLKNFRSSRERSPGDVSLTPLTPLNRDYMLTSVNLEGCSALESININDSFIESLNIAGCSSLESIMCSNSKLVELDCSSCLSLKKLYCDKSQLESLSIEKSTFLEILNCSNNNISILNLENNSSLVELDCSRNQIEILDLTRNSSLKKLSCSENNIKTLDLINTSLLEELYCSYNNIESLLISKLKVLSKLGCNNNKLLTLDVNGCTSLLSIQCGSNLLDETSLNSLFNSLETNNNWQSIYIENNPGTSSCDKQLAIDKGWTVNT